MKKILTLLIFTSFIWSCNNTKQTEKNEAIDSSDHREASEGLVLNDGDKWKADSSTGKNVENLFAAIDAFNSQPDRSLTAYNKAADNLQQALDKMIGECEMQGPEHEALHKWLLPLMRMVKSMKETKNEDDAAASLEEITKQVSLYPQYFER